MSAAGISKKKQKELLNMKLRKLSAILLVTAAISLAASAWAAEYRTKLTLTLASAAQTDEAYVLTVPADLTISSSGWNALSGLKVEHDTASRDKFSSSKKVVVTAVSSNDVSAPKLKSGENLIAYTFKTASSDTTAATALSFEFSADEVNAEGGTSKSFGVDVADFSTAPNGTYEDYITYTAEVQSVEVSFTVKRVGGEDPDYTDGNYTVAAGTTWQQFIDSGNAPTCLSIEYGGVWHDADNSLLDCGGTAVANTADKKRVKPDDAIIDGATYACSDYLNYQDHD